MKKNYPRPMPMKPEQRWGLFNWGVLTDVFWLRRDAWKAARENVPGEDARKYYTVEKVRITKPKP